ncbi:hypothetical protein [Phenylobacterium sp.]|jgi:predicted lysophospholipase L1 biosynthesis ABC-type transport system permease subunit|uniref:hypothetical protein n=1 Tax=Phenylobacterium sp. TaxID=1871053 RepID=UPI00120B6C46|nr:hypothetical protein [Phenylobacterium sp.]THD72212.1 MAG: hypothetical protein E8A12_00860 [Phenylobacterium sp.]
MSANLDQVKRRGALVAALCGVAFLAAVAGFVFYFKFGQEWARLAAVAALVIGFGAQTWFIASLRRPGKGA